MRLLKASLEASKQNDCLVRRTEHEQKPEERSLITLKCFTIVIDFIPIWDI